MNWIRETEWNGFGNRVSVRSSKPRLIASVMSMKPGELPGRVRYVVARPRSCANYGIGERRKPKRSIVRHFTFCRTASCWTRPNGSPLVNLRITNIFPIAAGALFAKPQNAECNCRKEIGRSDRAAPERARLLKL